jgi:hypothetical protein
MTSICGDCKKGIMIDSVKEINGNSYCHDCYFEELIRDIHIPKKTVVLTVEDMRFQLKEQIYMEKNQIENQIKALKDELLRLEKQSKNLSDASDSEIIERYSNK